MRVLLLATLLLAPLASAQWPTGIDATVTIPATGEPDVKGDAALVRIVNSTPGERYEFRLTIPREYVTLEFRLNGFAIERPRQIVPSLALPDTEYPLFNDFPNERVWEADGPARVFHVSGSAQAVVLRLGVDGPAERTLFLERDVTPPTFRLGAIEQVTHFSFYQETFTPELAVGDLQVRRVGTTEWVVNPTPMLHFRQRFPVQGLSPETEYEARVVFTDWAGNQATSDIYRVKTGPAPVLPAVTVTPVEPLPNATVNTTFVTMRARVESPESPLLSDALTVFFDKRPINAGVRFENGTIVYAPPEALKAGKHSIAVEVRNEAGAKGEAHWSFTVEPARETPLPPLLGLAALAVALFLARR